MPEAGSREAKWCLVRARRRLVCVTELYAVVAPAAAVFLETTLM